MSEVQNPLLLADIDEKLNCIETSCKQVNQGLAFEVPEVIARDVEVLPLKSLPKKPGLSKPKGQARLLHDLASIELQAMELGFRTLVEFPEAAQSFRQELTEVVLDEARHLQLCLNGLEDLGHFWGEWPVHTVLWQSVSAEDSLLDRILIVHRYLEGSGLDAGSRILEKLQGTSSGLVRSIVRVINEEEIGHVLFGSNWYRFFCGEQGLDPEEDFVDRMKKLSDRVPRRLEKFNYRLREQAGFSLAELEVLEALQDQQVRL